MISLFPIAPNDQSIYYLGQLFGAVGTILPVVSTTIFGALFKTLNTTALVLGSFLIIQVTVMGLLKSASEGEFLGKQWSSMWLPFRMILGIGSLFPTTSGYSLLQAAMMWFIVQGIGAADTVWTNVLDYVSQTGQPYATMATPTLGYEKNFKDLSQALVCQAEAIRTDADTFSETDGPHNYYYCKVFGETTPVDSFCKLDSGRLLNITDMTTGQTSLSNGIITYNMGPNGTCGKLSFPDPATYVDTKLGTTPVCTSSGNQKADLECGQVKQEEAVLQTIVNTLGTLATTVAEYDHQYLAFALINTKQPPPNIPDFVTQYCQANSIAADSCCFYNDVNDPPPPPPPAIPPPVSKCQDPTTQSLLPSIFSQSGSGPQDMTNVSQTGAQKLYWFYALRPGLGASPNITKTQATLFVSQIALAAPTTLVGWSATAQSLGWLMAGTYYYNIAGMSNSVQTMPPLSVTGTDPFQIVSKMTPYRNNYEAMGEIIDVITQQSNSAIPSSASPQSQAAANVTQGGVNTIIASFESLLTGSGNPLMNAQSFGENLVKVAEDMYYTFVAVAFALLVVATINFMFLGSGLTNSPARESVKFILGVGFVVLFFFCGWAISFGGMLAIYTPLVPYILFTFASIGWFISTIEAMIAAPFVALGILSPSGHHEILGRAEPALMILLNTFMRPTLMIVGMMAGMLLVPIVVQVINSGYNAVIASIYSSSTLGPVEIILFVTSYATLVLTAMNKCFSLIYIIPERTLTWIGGQAISGGEAESLSAVEKATEAMADQAGETVTSTAGSIVDGMKKMRENAFKGRNKGGKTDGSLSSGSSTAGGGDDGSDGTPPRGSGPGKKGPKKGGGGGGPTMPIEDDGGGDSGSGSGSSSAGPEPSAPPLTPKSSKLPRGLKRGAVSRADDDDDKAASRSGPAPSMVIDDRTDDPLDLDDIELMPRVKKPSRDDDDEK